MQITGSLFHAHTGHHNAELLIYIRDIAPRVIDDRNVYPEAWFTRSGTGVLIGGSLIAAAAHVVSGMLGLTVSRGLYRSKAELVHFDADIDLAVLRIVPLGPMRDVLAKAERLVRPIRTWLQPQLGERIHAYGFPFRPILLHALNMTDGIVSARVGRNREKFQISAALQRGNSGGPVCDANGNLVGIVTSSLEPVGGHPPENVNFAVRSPNLKDICRQLDLDLEVEELREPIAPVALAKIMHQLCFEVECWEVTA